MLADQAVVHACDLDEDELRWLSDQAPPTVRPWPDPSCWPWNTG